MFPIGTEIELRKLILFGQLCRLSSDFGVKTMFLNRVMSYRINPSKQTGFIVEIEKILQKYELCHILYTYIQDGVFPGMIKAKVHDAKSDWYNPISIPEFYSFKLLHVHGQFGTHWLWLFSKDNRILFKPCTSVVQLISCVSSLPHISSSCNKCQCDFTNLADHCIHECTHLNRLRDTVWRDIFSLGQDILMYLLMQDKLTFTNLLIDAESAEFSHILSERSDDFKIVCILNLHRMWSAYKATIE